MKDKNIDVIVTWVDDSDTNWLEKINFYVDQYNNIEKEAISSVRFKSYDEIRYCVRSIRNHAPWVRNIFIITDNQYPKCFLKEKAIEHRIMQVNHSTVFRGFEKFLPTFNSRSIETVMWRIPGLSEQFIYMNDDMFFCRRVEPDDFFSGKRPIVRGKWKKTKNSFKNLSLYDQGLIKSTQIFYKKSNFYFKPIHFPCGMNKKTFYEIWTLIEDNFINNASYAFRRKDQFQPAALHHVYSIYKNQAVLKRGLMFGYKPPENISDLKKIKPFLDHVTKYPFFRHGFLKAACINNWETATKCINSFSDDIEKLTGPPQDFECTS